MKQNLTLETQYRLSFQKKMVFLLKALTTIFLAVFGLCQIFSSRANMTADLDSLAQITINRLEENLLWGVKKGQKSSPDPVTAYRLILYSGS